MRNISNDLAALRTNSAVEFFRNSYGADCVLLLTNGDYGNVLGLTAGLGGMCTTGADKAYSIVDVDGTKIRSLEQQSLEAGESSFHWNLGDLPAGMYQIQTATNHSRTVKKVAIFH